MPEQPYPSDTKKAGLRCGGRLGFSRWVHFTSLGGGVAHRGFGSSFRSGTFEDRSRLDHGAFTTAGSRTTGRGSASGGRFATTGRSLIATGLNAATVATCTTLFATAQVAARRRFAAGGNFAARGGSWCTAGSWFTYRLAAGDRLATSGLAALRLAATKQSSFHIHSKASYQNHSRQRNQKTLHNNPSSWEKPKRRNNTSTSDATILCVTVISVRLFPQPRRLVAAGFHDSTQT